jgi:hypothetical protein
VNDSPPKTIQRCVRGLQQVFALNPILSNASAKIISVDEPLSTRSFPKVQLAILASITKASLWGKPCSLTSSYEKVIGIWDHRFLSTLPSTQMFRTSRK